MQFFSLPDEATKAQRSDDSDQARGQGSQKSFTFERPNLLEGAYGIKIVKSVSADEHNPDDTTQKKFEVLVPRFELPSDAIYSVYPEQGREVTNDVLPHIVFTDRTLPWERIENLDAEDHYPDHYDKNHVPWLALLVFTPDELQLSTTEMATIFQETSIKTSATQSDTMGIQVPIADLLELQSDTVRTPFTDTEQAAGPDTTVIFPTAFLFNGLFAAYDSNNQPTSSRTGGPDLSRHRFLAHLMRTSMGDVANADQDEQEAMREFSIVVANRVGPLVGETASHMIAHLVSLENLETLKPFPLSPTMIGESPVRVGLVSLHSWTYTCLPPNSPNIRTVFETLAHGADMLKPIIPHREDLDANAKRIISRLEDGFTIVRSRTQTGEETTALLRGALTPNLVPPIEWGLSSSTGSDLKILDADLGTMDITFSTAWSLGRTLALADRAFATSLTRIRHQILHPKTRAAMDETAAKTVESLGPCLAGTAHKSAPPDDTFNEAASPDWKVVLRFVLDLYHLVNVPQHYLLVEQSLLPRESLRFFFIDPNWINVLIDGALSLGNHELTNERKTTANDAKDPARKAIKEAISLLFEDPNFHKPTIPRFGFYLRSTIVNQFPDLKVSVQVTDSTSGDAYPLRQEVIDEETMIVFFSDAPLKEGLLSLRFELPANKQYFSAGTVTDSEVDIVYKRQYTALNPRDEHWDVPVATLKWKRNNKGVSDDKNDERERDRVFIWGTSEDTNDLRLLLVEKLAADVHQTLLEQMPKLGADWYTETTPTSAMTAFQLNNSPVNIVTVVERVELPEYDYHISSRADPSDYQIPMIEEKQDLIFSILYNKGGESLSLKYLTITISLVATQGIPPNTLLEMSWPGGAQVSMVSNLRFNTLLVHSEDGKALEIQILPWSRQGSVPMCKITELSVILSQVNVKCYRDVQEGELRVCPLQVHTEYDGNISSDTEIYATLRGVKKA
ncbi:hypothetical protein FSARC_5920 [Fusarium sarcochroum]|uniref:Uncharacterized protein n=1 Tax=Fusarium sarcochroum TaxID=1208366 RepID=A0A8H4TYE0_9HYPO|nr:hypothetical protein FSARC_5920 [Fusarium sarcochroum]